jgi:hypothetical protein
MECDVVLVMQVPYILLMLYLMKVSLFTVKFILTRIDVLHLMQMEVTTLEEVIMTHVKDAKINH